MSDPKRLTPPFGVLLMAYGSPATLRDVEAYYTHIRGGRTPPAERVAELRARYERIGGRGPPRGDTYRPAPRGARAREAQRQCAGDTDVPVIFTAHGLPVRILEWNDPYPEQLQQTCVQVAAAAKVRVWRFAYQSASATGEPWLGPDLLDVVRAIPREGQTECIVCPVGFVADHLEVLYDIDVEAKELATTLGLRLIRARSLNDDQEFVSAVADVIRTHLPQGALA